MEYGVSTQNKFAFLGDDEEVTDPEEVLQRAEKESKEKPKGKEVKKVQVVVPEKKVANAPSANKENVDVRRGPPRKDQRGGGGYKSGPRGPRRSTGDENAPPGDISDRFGENRPPRNQNRRNNKDGDNTGRDNRDGWQKSERPPRQTRYGDNNVSDSDGQQVNRPPRGDRPFRRGTRTGERGPPRGDRQSGDVRSGPRPGAGKKGGHGAANWGTEQDELAVAAQPEAAADTTATDDWGLPATVTQEETQDTGAAPENEENKGDGADDADKFSGLTLQEWKAQQKQTEPQFKIRKAGEGGDQKIYQKLVPLKKESDKDAHTTEDEDEHQMKREPRERALNIEISFNKPSRGHREGYDGPRSNRGGDRPRGGGRGGGYQGERGPRRNFDGPSGSGRRQNQGQGFNLTQESFPALGAQ